MSDDTAPRKWVRPNLKRTAPHRGAAGYYRTAPGDGAGAAVYGVAPRTTEDAAVSLVRAAYRVIDAQMERGARIARSLRESSARQGSGEPAEALDAAEQLARKSFLAGVEWLETVVAEPGNPVKRVLAAEYRWLGAALGILPGGSDSTARDRAPASTAAQPVEVTPSRARSAHPDAEPIVRIEHTHGSACRAVSIVSWQVPDVVLGPKDRTKKKDIENNDTEKTETEKNGTEIYFFHVLRPGGQRIRAEARRGVGGPVLALTTTRAAPSGRWKGAVVRNGVQLGVVEIEL